ncbi:MAG: hypothetical protein J0L92_24870 [Deltaproteobacteria bacterium]|nr:hypothetical protein [Deltaproteobacteria bacterium]
MPDIDVSNWTSGELLMRVHSKNVTGATSVIGVELRRTLPSPQDPSRTFEESGTAPPQIVITPNTGAAPLLLLDAVNAPLGSFMNLYVRATQSSTPGTIQATISVELVLKK